MLNLFQHPFSLWDSFALLGLRMTDTFVTLNSFQSLNNLCEILTFVRMTGKSHREAESRGDPKKFQGIASVTPFPSAFGRQAQ